MKEAEIDTIEDYLTVIKQHRDEGLQSQSVKDVVFRGQRSDLPLIPKLCRLRPKGDLLQIEKIVLDEFKRSNPLLIQPYGALDDWDYLTLGQHFGLPTRLLDWSNNALTALWFALSGDHDDPRQHTAYAVVWILLASEHDFISPVAPQHPFDVDGTMIFRPRLIRQRINSQSGVFSISSSADILDKRAVNESDGYAEKLVKVKIPACRIPGLRHDLSTLGVHAFSIFPELEGLCTFLQWRFFE